MALQHTQRRNVYHICQRCGFVRPLATMIWQNGTLVCSGTNCIDTAIIGNYEINVARAVSIWRHELEPDQKLITPVDRKDDQNDVLY